MDLLGYLRVLRRRWVLIVALGAIGAGLGVGSALLNRATSTESTRTYYRATNVALLDSTDSSSFPSTFDNMAQVALLATTGDVPEAVAEELTTSERGVELARRITTTVDQRTATFSITAVERDPDQAVLLADTWAKVLAQEIVERDTSRYNRLREQYTQRINQIKALQDQLLPQAATNPQVKAQYDATTNDLSNAYGALTELTAGGAPRDRFSTLEPAEAEPISEGEYNGRIAAGAAGQNHLDASSAEPPTYATASGTPAVNGPVERGVLGGVLGLLAGIGLALLAERLDRRLRLREDAEQAFGLPVLAEIPQLTGTQQRTMEIVTVAQPMSRSAEAYRGVRSALQFAHALVSPNGQKPAGDAGSGSQALVVMVSSPGPGDGKTTITANLAAAFAEGGARVLVVNCDFRRPTIHKLFHVDDEGRRLHETFVPGVQVVTNALSDPRANPTQVIAAQRSLIDAARSRFDVILLDTAPLLVANDAAEMVAPADLVLLAARMERTTTDSARRSIELLNRLDAAIAGLVLVGTDEAPSAYYTYYQNPTGQGAPVPPPPAPASPPSANGHANGTQPASTSLFPTDEPLDTTS